MKHKRKSVKDMIDVEKPKKEKSPPEMGTFRYFYQMKKMNPIDIYHERISYLKAKRKNKRNSKKSLSKKIKNILNKNKEEENTDV